MRPARRPLAAAALTVLALTAASGTAVTGTAVAEDQPTLSITPDPAVPGSTVIVSVAGGCTETSATATSTAFSEAVELSTGSAGTYTGTATVAESTTGTHSVSVTCAGGTTSTHRINVGHAGGSAHTPPPRPDSPTVGKGVKAGIGADDKVTAFDTAQLVLGGLLMAGAIGGTLYVVRRRSTP
ncbi:hypothetical protein [Streptomyces sp. NPDC052225]|uniref:hypothetical protein n=1 Tax=Streptomyces sp. NPDC052225 TaxID=3154949 RepID=UPI00341C2D92